MLINSSWSHCSTDGLQIKSVILNGSWWLWEVEDLIEIDSTAPLVGVQVLKLIHKFDILDHV
jgi:hypothetical protein